jgi:hypothetical protein
LGIRLRDNELLATLDEAIALARIRSDLPQVWVKRVERLGGLGYRTYVAALGGALLAKATDPRVDSLTQDEAAGPRGYSLRKSTEFLSRHNSGRFHLGATGRWPLNNRPFLGGPSRIDEFAKILPRARPAFELFLDCVTDLNRLNEDEALEALAAFLHVRIAVANRDRAEGQRALSVRAEVPPDQLLGICERFLREDAEGGRRGQAFVAALFDCMFHEVLLRSINDPHPGDVCLLKAGEVTLTVEVKQLPVTEEIATELAREAKALGARAGLLVVLADRHEPLDRERVRRTALRDLGVAVEICESVRELVGAAAVFSGGNVDAVFSQLPGKYELRMREHGVSEGGQRRWRQLVEARASARTKRRTSRSPTA